MLPRHPVPGMFYGMRQLCDGHLDIAINAVQLDRDLTLSLAELKDREKDMRDHKCRAGATVTIPAMREARMLFCMATLLARHGSGPMPAAGYRRIDFDYGIPIAAYASAEAQLAYYREFERQGIFRILSNREDLAEHCSRTESSGPIGIIVAMEGSDPILSPAQVPYWWQQGLRVASHVHYGKGRYAHGTGTSGPLTDQGRELLRAFEEGGVILDVTHLSDTSFYEASDLYSGPLAATHNNCRAVVPGDRQFSDDQVNRLVARGAVIGVALDAWMLYPGWVRGSTDRKVVSIDAAADHIDRICQLAGNTANAAIGSDLDGGFGTEQTPRDVDSIADIHLLEEILAGRGYSDQDIDAILFKNWQNFFAQNLPDHTINGKQTE